MKHKLMKMIMLSVAATGLMANSASAQVSNTLKAEAAIQEIGTTFNGQIARKMRAIYTPLHKAAPSGPGPIIRDVAYGPDPRHRLDIHQHAGLADGRAPILVFLHGGGFSRGSKSRDGLIYDNVLKYAARNGILGINVNYRLAPEFKWPSGPEDISRIISWLKVNANKYGGDPNQIFLMGHSAGARHVAAYTFLEKFHAASGEDGVKGAILVSGNYRPNINRKVDRDYFGEDASIYAERTTLNHLDGRRIPVFVVDAELDLGVVKRSSAELVEALCKLDGKCPRNAEIKGHNHMSVIFHLNTADESLSPNILSFISHNQ